MRTDETRGFWEEKLTENQRILAMLDSGQFNRVIQFSIFSSPPWAFDSFPWVLGRETDRKPTHPCHA